MAHSSQPFIETTAYRLRTKRQRRRARLKDRDRQLLALDKRRETLWQLQRERLWILIDPPIVRGWKRSFILRDDVARHQDAPLYERILERINETQYSYRRDFKQKTRRQGRKIHVVREQHLKRLDSWEWSRCAFTPEEAAQFDWVGEPSTHGAVTWRAVFREPWRFVLRIQPNIITKTRQHDEGLEAELKAIANYLDRNQLHGRLNTLLKGGGYRSWRRESNVPKDRSHPSRRSFRNVPLHAILGQNSFFQRVSVWYHLQQL
ncbi:MAG: hypothetical protein EOP52_04095 [Sphingobacteriales bacterium]|nr:MAG: hypothetical protein EOP52_04095 [Sphingobacteriales bacterium]